MCSKSRWHKIHFVWHQLKLPDDVTVIFTVVVTAVAVVVVVVVVIVAVYAIANQPENLLNYCYGLN